ncbi:LEAF RUST 10 DISEASE-RESISTANCE LOCUS RECEPTOR-LIKE PROTEIN KINASE-like 1.1 [Macadamia integrifolia]|uniref:LEAF RUST 10 DISEASE-RESISTANCE LOCUS RECEPTOR-LIKE PROTEIN KINASE-like 1.1 n=1 Tax=Macadamia integrifolia TaxID=60698 RepID=UPI001C4EFE41|nr:LEAF RUST 10 DISEASE-RESISTANCE LOCUS RECEPTOR-LIKE PROTEIN KINASE-like 1.1 [Macadamia integrifolia]
MMGSPSLSFHAFVLVFPFFLLVSSQLSLASVEEENLIQRCSFQSKCGELNISYPFTKLSEEECGLGIINCVDNSKPRLNYSSVKDDDLQRFEVKSVDYNNEMIKIHDQKFTGLIQRNNCRGLYNLSSLPHFSGNLTFNPTPQSLMYFRICKNGDPNTVFDDRGLWGVRLCGDRVLYFSTDLPPPGDPKSDCNLVEFPADLKGEANNLLDRLSLGFFLQWTLPHQCLWCKKKGTFCLIEQNGITFCAEPKQGKGKVKWIIITGIASGGILLICLVFFFIYYRRCRKGALFALFKTKSSSPSLTPLSASIASFPHYGVPVFTYEELEEATNNFNPDQELGDGGFGTVYYGKLQDGREVAVKRLYENNCKRVEQFMNEIGILARLRHQNLVTLYGCTSRHSRELLLVYEFIPNGTLADHLHGDRAKSGSPPWPTRMSIAIETAQALSYLHASDIIHRDVKTNNILLCQNFQVKVADFGLSRLFPTDVTHVSTAPMGTPGYVDPEYHRCYRLTEKSDVYSFGVVLIELISSKPAVDISRHRHEINLANLAINKIQNRAVHELVDPCLGYETDVTVKGMVTSVAALAFRCLQNEKELRPSMDEVLEGLKGIESEDYKTVVDGVQGAEVIDIPMNYAVEGPSNDSTLPSSSPPAVPPNSFTDKGVSS